MSHLFLQTAAVINVVSNAIETHFPSLLEHRYILLFIASSLEGFNTMILAGFLISIGTLALVPAFIICVIGEIINSSIWYGVGYWGGAKPIEWFVRNSPRKQKFVRQIQSYLQRYTGRIVLLMKLTYSVTIPAMILTGSLKYRFTKFTFYNVLGSIGWVIVTFSIGAFFGAGYKHYIVYFENISYLVLFIILAIIVIYFIERFGKTVIDWGLSFIETIREAGEKIGDGLDKIIGNGDDQ